MAPALVGLIAGAIGAVAVLYFLPEGWPRESAELESRVSALESQPTGPDTATLSGMIADEVAPLREQVEAFDPADAGALAALEDRLAALEESLQEVDGVDLDAFDQRLQSLAARIEAAESDAPGPDLGPLERALDDLSARLTDFDDSREEDIRAAVSEALEGERAAQEARAQALDDAADALASEQARLAARMALTELSIAAESGAPAPDALSRIGAVAETPAAMDAFADGLPTLAELQADFPEAARRALIAAPVRQDAPLSDRVSGFLRSQVGARSLAPRAGSDPDAVLSRAEAAVRDGRLSVALEEIDALPPAAAAELSDWRARAEQRVNALEALGEMQARLGSE